MVRFNSWPWNKGVEFVFGLPINLYFRLNYVFIKINRDFIKRNTISALR